MLAEREGFPIRQPLIMTCPVSFCGFTDLKTSEATGSSGVFIHYRLPFFFFFFLCCITCSEGLKSVSEWGSLECNVYPSNWLATGWGLGAKLQAFSSPPLPCLPLFRAVPSWAAGRVPTRQAGAAWGPRPPSLIRAALMWLHTPKSEVMFPNDLDGYIKGIASKFT